jgi:hypothetical protein
MRKQGNAIVNVFKFLEVLMTLAVFAGFLMVLMAVMKWAYHYLFR